MMMFWPFKPQSQRRAPRLRPLVLVLLITLLWLCPQAAIAQPNLEQQVLEIVRQHPEVVVEALQAYQRQQQEQRQAARQAVLDTLKTDPQTLIGASPTSQALENRAILLEFSDFQCPFCAQAHGTVQDLLANHPDEITVVYKHLPLHQIHPQAIPAAQAAYAAQQQGQFWAYHDALFEHQDELGDGFFVATAKRLELDLTQFERDRTSPESVEAIAQDMELAEQLGISGTPCFFFQGHTLEGAVPYEQFEALLKGPAAT
ncbi:MAG: DsbA family protein [Spirulinaceae cyanobacterium]